MHLNITKPPPEWLSELSLNLSLRNNKQGHKQASAYLRSLDIPLPVAFHFLVVVFHMAPFFFFQMPPCLSLKVMEVLTEGPNAPK